MTLKSYKISKNNPNDYNRQATKCIDSKCKQLTLAMDKCKYQRYERWWRRSVTC